MPSVSYLMYQSSVGDGGGIGEGLSQQHPTTTRRRLVQPSGRRKSSLRKEKKAAHVQRQLPIDGASTISCSSKSTISDSSLYTTSGSTDERDYQVYTSFRRRASFWNRRNAVQQEENNQGTEQVKVSTQRVMIQDLLEQAGLLQSSDVDGGVKVTSPPLNLHADASFSPSSVQSLDVSSTSSSPTSSQKSAIWKLMVEPKMSAILDATLEHVMDEVLLMDEDSAIQCTCPSPHCFYHGNDDVLDMHEAATPSIHNRRKTLKPPRPSRSQHSHLSRSSEKTSSKLHEIRFVPQTPPPPPSDESSGSDVSSLQAYGYAIPHGNVDGTFHKESMNYKQLQQQLLKQRSRHPSFCQHNRTSSILSTASYQTMVSEMTNLTTTPIQMDILPPLKLNPKAPQYQMALEQAKQLTTSQHDRSSTSTINSGGTTGSSTASKPQRSRSPLINVDQIKPPARRYTPSVHTADSPTKGMRQASPSIKTIKPSSADSTIQSIAATLPARHASPQKAPKPKVKALTAATKSAERRQKMLQTAITSSTAAIPTRHVSPQKTTKTIIATKPSDIAATLSLNSDLPDVPESTPSRDSDSALAESPAKTPPHTQQATISDLISPGVLTTVNIVNDDDDDDDAKKEDANHRLLLQSGRLSTLTYPSFASPLKQKAILKNDCLHAVDGNAQTKKTLPLSLPMVGDDEMEGSDDEDIGDAPRHLQCLPSIDSSDVTNSYGTSTSSSSISLLPYQSRAGSDGSLPPKPPKRSNNNNNSPDSNETDGARGENRIEQHQRHLQSLEDSMTGPFISPSRGEDNKKRTVLPSTPQQESNPLLFPMTIASKSSGEDDVHSINNAEMIMENPSEQYISIMNTSMEQSSGPFVTSPSSVHRSFHAHTPQQESNPLLFPRGLRLYPDIPFSDDDEDQASGGQSQQESKSANTDQTVRRTNNVASTSMLLPPQPPPPPKHQQDIEFIYTPSPVHDKIAIRDIDLSNHDDDFSNLHDTIDLTHLTPEQILHKSARAEESQRGILARTKSVSDRGSRNSSQPLLRHPSRQASPHSLRSQPLAPRRSVSFPQSVLENVYYPGGNGSGNSCGSSGSSGCPTSSNESTTTEGGEPSVTSSPYSRKSHSSRFTVTGTDPSNHFTLILDKDQQIEPSVFTGEDESEYDEDHSQRDVDDDEIVVEETVEYPESSTHESECSEYYEEMSVVMEEEEDEDESLDDVTALDDQSEQYESLKDPMENEYEYEELNDAKERQNEYLQARQDRQTSLQSMPSLVSNTSTSSDNISSLTSSSVTVCRVRMCPMEICYVLDGEEICYTGFYSGPVNARAEANGNGVFWFNTGDLYVGQFAGGNLHGCGMLSIVVDENVDEETGEVLSYSKEILKGYFRWNEYVGADPIGSIRR